MKKYSLIKSLLFAFLTGAALIMELDYIRRDIGGFLLAFNTFVLFVNALNTVVYGLDVQEQIDKQKDGEAA